MADKEQFIYTLDPVRPELLTDPNAWTAEDERTAEERFAYLQRATQEGMVLLAGRSLDGIGPAIVILEAETDREARHFMARDPFVRDGLMYATLHPFRVALVRAH